MEIYKLTLVRTLETDFCILANTKEEAIEQFKLIQLSGKATEVESNQHNVTKETIKINKVEF